MVKQGRSAVKEKQKRETYPAENMTFSTKQYRGD
jgi:hypothetical protein